MSLCNPLMDLASSWALGNLQRLPSGAVVQNLSPVTQKSSRSPFRLHSPSGLLARRATSQKEHRLVTCCTRPTGAGEGDRRPPETASKPYEAGKDGESRHVSDLKGERPPWVVCSCIHLPGGVEVKKRALELFSTLMGLVGEKIEFVVKPTTHHGTDVGVTCRLDWKKTLRLGNGSSFNTVHTYQGRTFISNVEAATENIIHSAAVKLMLMGCLTPVLSPMVAAKLLHGESRTRSMLLPILLLTMAVSVMLARSFHHHTSK